MGRSGPFPYFVVTVEPSTIGRRSRCTPSATRRAPAPLPAAICPARQEDDPRVSRPGGPPGPPPRPRRPASGLLLGQQPPASPTLTRRRRVRPGIRCESMSLRLIPTPPCLPRDTSKHRPGLLHVHLDGPVVELSGAKLSPELVPGGVARGVGLHLLEVRSRRTPGTTGPAGDRGGAPRPATRPIADRRRHLRLTMLTPSSVRSRIIDSTSRPT